MVRPPLVIIPLSEFEIDKPGQLVITMSVGQWDGFLEAAYDEGAFLLELDDDEKPVALYKKP